MIYEDVSFFFVFYFKESMKNNIIDFCYFEVFFFISRQDFSKETKSFQIIWKMSDINWTKINIAEVIIDDYDHVAYEDNLLYK